MAIKQAWLRRWFINVIYGGGKTADNSVARAQFYVLNTASLVGVVVLGVLGVLRMVDGSVFPGYLDIAGGVALLLNMGLLRVTGNIRLARAILLVIIMIALAMVLMRDNGQVGAYWFFAFPLLAFFLTNRREGFAWLLALFGLILLSLLLAQLQVIELGYSPQQIRQLAISLAVVSYGLYLYEKSREQSEEGRSESQEELQDYLDHMATLCLKLDHRGQIIFANGTAKGLLGLTREHTSFLKGEWATFDPDTKHTIHDLFEKANGGEVTSGDVRLQVQVGGLQRHMVVRMTMIPIFDREGNQKYVLAEARDITSITEAQAALERKTEDLEKLNQLMVGRELKMIELKKALKARDSS